MSDKVIMDRAPPSTNGAFNLLPIEVGRCCGMYYRRLTPCQMNWAIASYLESDKDIVTFRLICRQTCWAIEGNNSSFWREKFVEKYDHSDKMKTSNAELEAKYQERSKRLRRGVSQGFQKNGHGSSEKKLLNVLRSLILGTSFMDAS